jgi:hypothetical protein
MAVNTLVTGMIVYKIQRTLGSSEGRNLKFRHIIFVIIESGMALFAIQLIRIVLSLPPISDNAFYLVIGVHEMLNVIIRSVLFQFFYLTDDITNLERASHQQ